jgi:hypothetical protein
VVRSGESRLRNAEQLVGVLGRGQEPVIVGAQARDLEFEGANFCAEYGDLVNEASIRRTTNVAEEGLRHIFSFEGVADKISSARSAIAV